MENSAKVVLVIFAILIGLAAWLCKSKAMDEEAEAIDHQEAWPGEEII